METLDGGENSLSVPACLNAAVLNDACSENVPSNDCIETEIFRGAPGRHRVLFSCYPFNKKQPVKEVFTLSENPLVQKYVLKAAPSKSCRPPPEAELTYSISQNIRPDQLAEYMNDPDTPLAKTHVVRSDISSSLPDAYLSTVLMSMPVGQRCIVRQLKRAQQGAAAAGAREPQCSQQLDVIELVRVRKRITVVGPPNPIFLDVDDTRFAVDQASLHNGDVVLLHFSLYRRHPATLASEAVVPDADSPDWQLVLDTRKRDGESPLPHQVNLGEGTEIPGFELALKEWAHEGATGRIYCSASPPIYNASTTPSDAIAFRELFHELDLTKYAHLNLDGYHLLFDSVHVVDVRRFFCLPWEFSSFDLALERSRSLRNGGNAQLGRHHFRRAHRAYEEAYNIITEWKGSPETDRVVAQEEEYLLLNASLAKIKLGEHPLALHFIEKVLSINPRNPKALYRKSVCLKHLQRLDEAARLLQELHSLMPNDRQVRAELRDVNRLLKECTRGLSGLRRKNVVIIPEDAEGSQPPENNQRQFASIALFRDALGPA